MRLHPSQPIRLLLGLVFATTLMWGCTDETPGSTTDATTAIDTTHDTGHTDAADTNRGVTPQDTGPAVDTTPDPLPEVAVDTGGDVNDQGENEVLSDIGPDASDADSDDALPEWDSIKSDCEELGIANDWLGDFTGEITHDIIIPDGWGTPPAENLIVEGELTFAIECVDSKLQVSGKLDGFGLSGGEAYPFTLNLKGYYNPKTKELTADIVDGKVVVILIEVYFAGTFNGELVENEDGEKYFTGDWFAEATGTNAGELVTGTAQGGGKWTANPTDPPEPVAP